MNAPAVAQEAAPFDLSRPLSALDKRFIQDKYEYYKYLRAYSPVHTMKIVGMKVMAMARHEDCLALVKDERFCRNRTTATGGSRLPFPVPRSIALLSRSMIVEDDPEHRRLRALVQKAFAPKTLNPMEARVEALTHELMDRCLAAGSVDLQRAYALEIPTTVIREMMGVNAAEMPQFQQSLRVLSEGMTGWNVMRTFAWDMPRLVQFVRDLLARKRRAPGDDILTHLIEAEEAGDRLSEDELVSLVFLLIIAGYETTVHLITNGVHALLTHPEELERLRELPELAGSAVEEILRFCSPIHGTKMNYAKEDVEIRGVVIAKGTPAVPLLGSANHDEAVFEDPERFDIRRDPNKHLAFSQGNHFCLGAFLARMETRIAIKTLLERSPNLRLAVPPEALKLQSMPFWHRYDGLPVHVD